MAEIPNPEKRDISEALRGIEGADDPFFAKFERDVQEFLAENRNDPRFKNLFEKEKRRKIDLRKDAIQIWEEENQDYIPAHIDQDKVDVTNRSDKDVSFEFIDYLIGNLKSAAKDNNVLDILKDATEISVVRITQDNNGVYIIVVDKDKRKFGVLFQDGPEFKPKLIEIKEKIHTF